MTKLNHEKIKTLIGHGRKSFGELTGYMSIDDQAILSSSEKLGHIKYQLIVAIEACTDICNHISARMHAQTPESYAHCFRLLKEQKVIEAPLAEKMAELARFRNVLVHLYWQVNNDRVIEIPKK